MTITEAIVRSISRNEIVHVDLSDLLVGLRGEASSAGDDATVAAIDDLAVEHLGKIVGQLIQTAQNAVDANDCDDVKNDDTHELWGTTEDGDYRVHVRLDA